MKSFYDRKKRETFKSYDNYSNILPRHVTKQKSSKPTFNSFYNSLNSNKNTLVLGKNGNGTKFGNYKKFL